MVRRPTNEMGKNHSQRVCHKNTAIGGKWFSGLASFLSPEKLAVVDDVKGDAHSLLGAIVFENYAIFVRHGRLVQISVVVVWL